MRSSLAQFICLLLGILILPACSETPSRSSDDRPRRRTNFGGVDVDKSNRSKGPRKNVFMEETVGAAKGLKTRFYRLRHLKSDVVRKMIEKWKSGKGRILEIKESNLLVITDTDEHLEAMGKVLRRIDVQPVQVGIEAQIIEIQNTDRYEYGFELRVDRNPITKGSLRRIEGILPPQSFIDTLLPGGAANTNPYAFRGNSLTFNAVGHLFEELGDTELILRALQEEGYAKILSEPRIVVQVGEKASIETLTEIPIEETSIRNNVTTITTKFKKVGVQLDVTPLVVGTDSVTLKIIPEVSAVSGFSSGTQAGSVPIITTRKVSTRVDLRDGERLVIGGLYENKRVKRERVVPGLGHIPLIGHFFRSRLSEVTETEIVFMLKVNILDDVNKATWKIRVPSHKKKKK